VGVFFARFALRGQIAVPEGPDDRQVPFQVRQRLFQLILSRLDRLFQLGGTLGNLQSADCLRHGGVFGGGPLDYGQRRIRRQINAHAVAHLQPRNHVFRGFLANVPDLRALHLIIHAVGSVQNNRDIPFGARQRPGGVSEHRLREGESQQKHQQRPQQPQYQIFKTHPA